MIATASGQRNVRSENLNNSSSSDSETELSNNIIENYLKIWEYTFKKT